ncbi:hypothetical protein JK358_09510 [Nocardia sp. 2]|uniref:Serine/threonine protein kinase n=1 Tax=Nocardia acididurans TaxID=2802282 RepID=A0ABS1M674_9NOCA|nr:hypothetical protein [Nocardia acididurans]MBL1074633.1 hypothetical protein [Nocardia acididurans]
MKRAGPYLTLAAAAVLGGGLLVTNTLTGLNRDANTAGTATAPASPGASTVVNFPQDADYVTEIATDSRPITLSLTVTGVKAVGYACDGASVENWMRGAAEAGRMVLKGNNSQLEGTLVGDALKGTLTLGERTYDFLAPPVQPPAGLYLAQTANGRDSWIVGPDGSVTGVRRAPDGSTSPAPDLAPNARKVDGDDDDF